MEMAGKLKLSQWIGMILMAWNVHHMAVMVTLFAIYNFGSDTTFYLYRESNAQLFFNLFLGIIAVTFSWRIVRGKLLLLPGRLAHFILFTGYVLTYLVFWSYENMTYYWLPELF